MVLALHEEGRFTWPEWTAALAARLAAAAPDDDGTRYYDHWLEALEDLLIAKGVAAAHALHDLAHAWERAAEATPHGRPIRLENDPRHAA